MGGWNQTIDVYCCCCRVAVNSSIDFLWRRCTMIGREQTPRTGILLRGARVIRTPNGHKTHTYIPLFLHNILGPDYRNTCTFIWPWADHREVHIFIWCVRKYLLRIMCYLAIETGQLDCEEARDHTYCNNNHRLPRWCNATPRAFVMVRPWANVVMLLLLLIVSPQFFVSMIFWLTTAPKNRVLIVATSNTLGCKVATSSAVLFHIFFPNTILQIPADSSIHILILYASRLCRMYHHNCCCFFWLLTVSHGTGIIVVSCGLPYTLGGFFHLVWHNCRAL